MNETTARLLWAVRCLQRVQKTNPPDSAEWIAASAALAPLFNLLHLRYPDTPPDSLARHADLPDEHDEYALRRSAARLQRGPCDCDDDTDEVAALPEGVYRRPGGAL